MELSSWIPYLISVNTLGFLLFAADILLHAYRSPVGIDPMVSGIALLGGTGGILLSMVFFSRRVHRETMLSRIFLFCLFPVQLSLLLTLTGRMPSLPLWPTVLALAAWNLLTFGIYLIDKSSAIHRLPRVPTVTLLLLTYLGAAPGALAAMYLFHHKTRVACFRLGVPLMLVMQVVVVSCLL